MIYQLAYANILLMKLYVWLINYFFEYELAYSNLLHGMGVIIMFLDIKGITKHFGEGESRVVVLMGLRVGIVAELKLMVKNQLLDEALKNVE